MLNIDKIIDDYNETTLENKLKEAIVIVIVIQLIMNFHLIIMVN